MVVVHCFDDGRCDSIPGASGVLSLAHDTIHNYIVLA